MYFNMLIKFVFVFIKVIKQNEQYNADTILIKEVRTIEWTV